MRLSSKAVCLHYGVTDIAGCKAASAYRIGQASNQQVTGKNAVFQQCLIMIPSDVRFVSGKELANANIAEPDHPRADGYIMSGFQFTPKWPIG
jgi:hypothetical protein